MEESSAPSPQEAAAAIAAIERFLADTAAPPRAGRAEVRDGWHEAALREGVGRYRAVHSREPWINI
ncbi:MAG: hypothetical protein KGJ43_04670 [Acidobacteriota bacterium]|nr:hypothetical protein [Acidobacteriota bacterium]